MTLLVPTDWLWSCPLGMPVGEIAHQLGFSAEPRTELSVRDWSDEPRLKVALYQAFALGTALDRRVPYMVWDAFDDYLTDTCADGRLIVLRDVPTEAPY